MSKPLKVIPEALAKSQHSVFSLEVMLRAAWDTEFPLSQEGRSLPYQRSIVRWIELGYLKNEELEGRGLVRITPLGYAFVLMLKSTPLPEERRLWVDPRTGEVVGRMEPTSSSAEFGPEADHD